MSSVGDRHSYDRYGSYDYDRSAASRKGLELGQSPLLLLAIAAGITLIAVGQARKSNARREIDEQWKLQNTTTQVVPDAEAPGGPFRGAMKEVEVLDPTFAAIEEQQRAANRRKGNTFLAIGGLMMAGTILVIMYIGFGNDSPSRAIDNVLISVGLGFFPFVTGLIFAIVGLVKRS
jgi:hypothetical protein